MKVLWFTNTPSLYKKDLKGYNGCGWIESLERAVSEKNDIELAISFFHEDNVFKLKQDKVTYYPVTLYNSAFKKISRQLFYKTSEIKEINAFLKVIDDFKPDIIHIFGSEYSFGLLTLHTNIPIIIHIQGLLNPNRNAWFAPETNKWDYFVINLFKPQKLLKDLWNLYLFTKNTNRELTILKNCKWIMGRTNWDKELSQLFSEHRNYFYCSEMLRAPFYLTTPWNYNQKGKIKIITTISQTAYKGFDLILKTAKILKQFTSIDFEWNVYGVNEYTFWEKKLSIDSKNVSVHYKGVVDASVLVNSLQMSDIYVHPSYIDNSPNSICEAQILGMPVIATNVGGISSLIEDGISGILVPSNDPYTLAARIVKLSNDSNLAISLGRNAREVALKRHDSEKIISDLLSIYYKILDKNSN